jgi:hypothetical protein
MNLNWNGWKKMRTKSRIDANQPEIVEAFRALGCSVLHTHQLGHGAPDLIIGKNGRNVLIEVKDGKKPLYDRLLTTDERKFHREWSGWIEIVETIYDVTVIVKRLDQS